MYGARECEDLEELEALGSDLLAQVNQWPGDERWSEKEAERMDTSARMLSSSESTLEQVCQQV